MKSEEGLEPYGNIVEILRANRPPRNYQEAGDIAFEIRQLALFSEDVTFLLSDEDGGGSYLTEHKTLRTFRVLSQIFNVVGVLSGNLWDWASIEEGRGLQAKNRELKLQKKEDEGETIYKD